MTPNISVLKDKDAKMAYLDKLLLDVVSGRGGSGDYTKEKYESPGMDLEELCAQLEAMAAARRGDGPE